MVKAIVVPFSMLWLKKRLKEIDKSGAALARHLKIPKERVYEMYVGKRRLQQDEIGPTARFLDWTEAELVAHLEGRALNETKRQAVIGAAQQVEIAPQPLGDIGLRPLVQYRTAPAATSRQGGIMLYAERIDEVPRPFFLRYSQKAFAARVLDDKMHPAYRRWDIIIVDPDSPAIEGEDCLFTNDPAGAGGSLSVIGCLKSSTAQNWTVHQYGPKADQDLPRADFPNAWPIVGRYNRR